MGDNRMRGLVKGLAAIALLSTFVAAGVPPANALPGNADSIALDVSVGATVLGLPVVDLSGQLGTAVAPTSGTVSIPAGDLSLTGVGADVSITVDEGAAGQDANSTFGSVHLSSVAIDVLGLPVLGADDLIVGVSCPATGAPTVATSASSVSVLGTNVTLSTTPTVVAAPVVDLSLGLSGLASGTLTASARLEETTTASSAVAAAIVELHLALDLPLIPNVFDANLGTIRLPSAACEAPTIDAPGPGSIGTVLPLSGSTAGGTEIVITGVGLSGATGVTVGGVSAPIVSVIGDTTVVATTPASEVSGAVDVSVTGTSLDVTATGAFSYVAPSFGSIAPLVGPSVGGTPVALLGVGLSGATGVTVGGVPGTGLVVGSDLSLTFDSPAGVAGSADVVVELPGLDLTVPDGFIYSDAAASIGTVLPLSGSTAGGTEIVITGVGLSGATGVTVGGAPGTGLVVGSDLSLTFDSPPGVAGPADVVVELPGLDLTIPDGFTFLPPPFGATPSTLSTVGGAEVSITGAGFAGATLVTIGGETIVPTVLGDGELTFIATSSEVIGDVNVVITTPLGEVDLGPIVSYVAPTIDSGIPTSVPQTGGAEISLVGAGLGVAVDVLIDGTSALAIETPDGATIDFLTPVLDGVEGSVDLTVVLPGVDVTVPGAITVTADPSLAAAGASLGLSGGGETFTVFGQSLDSTTNVQVDGVDAAFTVLGSTALEVSAPAGSSLNAAIDVTTAFGSADLADGWTYADTAANAIDLGASVEFLGADLLAADVVVSQVIAPVSGTESSAGATAALSGTGVAVDATVLGSSATQGAVNNNADADLADASLSIFDQVVLDVGVIEAAAVCAAGSSPTTSTSVADVTLFGTPVVVSSTPTILSGAVVGVATPIGDADGTIELEISSVETITATTASATALRVRGSVALSVGGVAMDVQALTLDLGHAHCTMPTTEPPSIDNVGVGITGVSEGPTSGGVQITITGSNLSTTTDVFFGATPANDIEIVDDSTVLAVSAPTETPGPVDVTVTTPVGDATLTDAFNYLAPTISLVVEDRGPAAGGTPIVISGSGLAAATDVLVGGAAATDVVVVDDGEITAVTPPGTADTVVDVTVVLPGTDALAEDAFTYEPVSVGSVSVDGAPTPTGPVGGGTTITITGTSLDDIDEVLVGGVPATDVTVVDSETVTAVTPPASGPGTVDITVSGPDGTDTLPDAFTYVDPVIADVSPSSGPAAGGTTITITGVGLGEVVDVLVGGVPATDVVVVNDNEITAVTPPLPAGTAADVSVVLPDQTVTAPGGFTAEPVSVGSVSVDGAPTPTGPVGGGTTITITGTSLDDIDEVLVGGVPATDVTVVDSETVTAVTPPASGPGTVDITVSGPDGTDTLPDAFTYAESVITDVSPSSGPAAGGTTITITGTGLEEATSVSIGGIPAGDVTVVSEEEITATTPELPPGNVVDVEVELPDETIVFTGGFSSDPVAIGSVSVDGAPAPVGPLEGGTPITITGTSLDDIAEVFVGGVPATDVTVVDSGTVTAVTPPATRPAMVDIKVSGPTGEGSFSDGFQYMAIPRMDGLSPGEGPMGGGVMITASGSGLWPDDLTVTVGGVEADRASLVGSLEGDEVSFELPPTDVAGPVLLEVSTRVGASTQMFLYSEPDIADVTPSNGPLGGGTEVTITGQDIGMAEMVLFGREAGTGLTIVDGQTIRVATPAGSSVGDVDVTVVYATGQVTRPAAFTYQTGSGDQVPDVLAFTGSGLTQMLFLAGVVLLQVGGFLVLRSRRQPAAIPVESR